MSGSPSLGNDRLSDADEQAHMDLPLMPAARNWISSGTRKSGFLCWADRLGEASDRATTAHANSLDGSIGLESLPVAPYRVNRVKKIAFFSSVGSIRCCGMKTANLYILHEPFLEFSALCIYESARRYSFAAHREKATGPDHQGLPVIFQSRSGWARGGITRTARQPKTRRAP